MNKFIFHLNLLILLAYGCSKNDEEKSLLEKKAYAFVAENKSYYFHSVSTLYHMRIETNELGEAVDTTWNTKRAFTYSVYFHQDTLFNDTLYKYVWYKTQEKNYKIGLIREAEEGKIYYKANPYNPEKLLYNFALDLNEKFNNYLVVNNIDILENNGYKRKQLLLTQCCRQQDSLIWIEGIGNTNNILNNDFDEQCYCGEDGFDIVANTTGGWKTKTDLLFVKLENAVIYKNPAYSENPKNFRFTEKTEYY